VNEGDRVRMNTAGRELFDKAGKAEGLLLRIDGAEGNVQWESGQSTRISLSCIESIPASSGSDQ
jgi:hypothetical protein